MPQLKTSHKVGGAAAAAVIAATVAFLPNWEGTDYVAKRDAIGTGHPITWCHGQTPADEPNMKVHVGQRFTKEQCDAELAKSLPKYLDKIGPAVHVAIPVKSMAALLDASYNAGAGAVIKSPMVRQFNAGNFKAACDAFKGWYVRSDDKVRKGLIARRAGETVGDTRKSERALCIEGLKDTTTPLYLYGAPVEPQEPPKPIEAPKTATASWQEWFWSK